MGDAVNQSPLYFQQGFHPFVEGRSGELSVGIHEDNESSAVDGRNLAPSARPLLDESETFVHLGCD